MLPRRLVTFLQTTHEAGVTRAVGANIAKALHPTPRLNMIRHIYLADVFILSRDDATHSRRQSAHDATNVIFVLGAWKVDQVIVRRGLRLPRHDRLQTVADGYRWNTPALPTV